MRFLILTCHTRWPILKYSIVKVTDNYSVGQWSRTSHLKARNQIDQRHHAILAQLAPRY